MKTNALIRVFLLAIVLSTICQHARGQDVLIVVNKDSVITQITSAQLRDIFTGTRSRFGSGSRVVPVLLKGGPVHEVFLHHYVGDNPDEFRARWRKAVFTGQGSMPKEFASEAALLEYVAATPGAIGYVSRVQDPTSVKVLTVTATQ